MCLKYIFVYRRALIAELICQISLKRHLSSIFFFYQGPVILIKVSASESVNKTRHWEICIRSHVKGMCSNNTTAFKEAGKPSGSIFPAEQIHGGEPRMFFSLWENTLNLTTCSGCNIYIPVTLAKPQQLQLYEVRCTPKHQQVTKKRP